jgi:predicted amidohydrolase
MDGNRMKSFLRFAGAQIPVRKTVEENIITLKTAIDWASDNEVHYLVTPEASLSGYIKGFNINGDVVAAEKEIVSYAVKKSVGLFLGTLWVDTDPGGKEVKRNQLRVYDSTGKFIGAVNKTLICPEDHDIGIIPNKTPGACFVPGTDETGNPIAISAAGFICKDLYGRSNFPNLPSMAREAGVMIGIHATNAMRNVGDVYDKVMYDWHNANLQIVSYLAGGPFITVDNCNLMNGDDWDGQTSSPSGVLIGGEWVVQVPSHGTQYFFYDFPIRNLIHRDWPNGPGKN